LHDLDHMREQRPEPPAPSDARATDRDAPAARDSSAETPRSPAWLIDPDDGASVCRGID
jgi:hypothetical protein